MPTTLEKEHQLQEEIAPRVEHDVPGIDVLAVELSDAVALPRLHRPPGGRRPRPVRARHRRPARLPARVQRRGLLAGTGPPAAQARAFRGALGRRVRLRTAGRKLRGEVLSAGAESVKVAAADGAETEIPYAEIVRANLIDEGACHEPGDHRGRPRDRARQGNRRGRARLCARGRAARGLQEDAGRGASRDRRDATTTPATSASSRSSCRPTSRSA